MNLPTKLTMSRLFLTIVIILLFLFPFNQMGISFPSYALTINNEILEIDSIYIISGILFIIASFTDFLDGKIARTKNLVTDYGKFLDAIADKVLVNSVLIILATSGFIHPLIPVIIVCRDTFVNTIKMIAGNKGKVVAAIKSGKLKTICMMIGISLTLFYNLPFELWNLRISDVFLYVACILSVVSAVQYYNLNKKYISAN